jgi:hypothetical protein
LVAQRHKCEEEDMATPNTKYVPTWRIVLAFFLDFITVFGLVGYIIARLTGQLTEGGFNVTGWPALLLFVIIVGYFVISGRLFGGTLWQYILKSRRRPGIDV